SANLNVGTVTTNGTIRLESIDSSYSETMTISGTLTNASTGVIQINAGTAGSRLINGALTNQGLISFSGAIDLGGTSTITNTGTIQRTDAATSNFGVSLVSQGTGLVNVAAGTIRFTGTTNVGAGAFLSGGSYHVANGATLGFGNAVSQRPTINTADIQITGTGVAEIDKLVTNRGEIELLGGNDLTVAPTGGVFTNEGIIDLSPDSIFSVTGNMNFAGASQPVIHSEIASATSFGKLTVSGTFNLDSPSSTSRFDPDLVGGYDPALGATFNVITANPVSNGFDSFQGGLTPSNNVLELTRPDANTVQVKITAGPMPPAPQILNESYDFQTREAIVFTFDQDVSAFLSRKDYLLQNLTTAQTVPSSAGTLSYNLNSNQATLTLTNQLPDGNYKLTVAASDIANAAGEPASGAPIILNFFVLGGDATRDSKVDVGDLGVLATNYGLSGKTYSQGDFNYDTKVDVGDLGILATNYGKSLAAGSVFSQIAVSSVATATSSRRTAAAEPAAAASVFATVPLTDAAWDAAGRRHERLKDVGLA
ncbi:MAG TPA: hypothetical protein VLI90_18425, partial [Tepidisphaeraceae bacterium]|nr:hypothetical protein [Tepidisphaeraceae bacterium]